LQDEQIFGNNFGNISQREYVEYGASTAVFNGKNAIFALLRRLITQRSQVQILTPLPIRGRKSLIYGLFYFARERLEKIW